MEIQKSLSEPGIKAADVNKLTAAIKNLTQTIDYEIKTLKTLAVIIGTDGET